MNRLDAALLYVRRGWEIFPVPPGTKAGYSVQSRGFDNGKPWGKTTDESEVRAYWAKLPGANVGLVMGIGSGIFDLECDTKEGHANLKQDGAASLAELEAKHGKLPATLMFESPSGSVHRLYRHPGGDIRIRSGALDAENYPGIDVKGDGGMSVAPPSRTRKGVYRWINKRRIAAAPAWLLDTLRKPQYATREPDGFAQFANWTRPVNISKLTLAVAMIPNDLKTSREIWVKVGFALWDATGGSQEGYQLFAAWSRRWPNYNAEKTRTFWDTIKTARCNITAGTIFYMADEAVPDWKERMYYEHKVISHVKEFYELLGEPEPERKRP
jgi:hypothetical protein